MATELYDLTVPVFTRGLTALSGVLDKAAAHATETGVDPDSYLSLRLIEDMRPLSSQIQMATDSPKFCIARLSGAEAPVFADDETTMAQLQDRIRATLDFLASVPADRINGQEDRDVVLKFPGGEIPFKGLQYAIGFAHPNFHFHLTIAYALLRQAGVPLGKRDYLGGM